MIISKMMVMTTVVVMAMVKMTLSQPGDYHLTNS